SYKLVLAHRLGYDATLVTGAGQFNGFSKTLDALRSGESGRNLHRGEGEIRNNQ
ncbi:hypothetical protein A2U01_0054639, partial [Trifolium medium]|nr:hypothetical protein [Trifolium medium]